MDRGLHSYVAWQRSVPAHDLLVVCFLMATMVIADGCGSGKPEIQFAPVSGKISYQGKPLSQGQIVMVHNSGKMGASEIGSDGSFRLEAPVGENLVMVDSRDQVILSQLSPKQGRPLKQPKSLIPEKYNDYVSSGLKLQVVEGGNVHDFQLAD